MLFDILFSAVLRVAVELFGADADIVKYIMCTNKSSETKKGGEVS